MRLKVSTNDGKYTVIQEDAGGMRFLRHGQPWPAADESFAHVGMILAIAQELEAARAVVEAVAKEHGANTDDECALCKALHDHERAVGTFRPQKETP